MFTRFLGMGPRVSNNLWPFKKHYTCTHMFGCYENLFRKILKATAVWLFAKGTFAFLFGTTFDQEITSAVKDNVKMVPQGWGKDELSLAWFGGQFIVMTGIAFYRTVKCWTI